MYVLHITKSKIISAAERVDFKIISATFNMLENIHELRTSTKAEIILKLFYFTCNNQFCIVGALERVKRGDGDDNEVCSAAAATETRGDGDTYNGEIYRLPSMNTLSLSLSP